MVLLDIIHLAYHMMEFLPNDKGRKLYVYYKCFDLDPDVFLFFTTNVCLLLIKIGYGVIVILKRFKQFTNTYGVLTTLCYSLILFLDFAMAAYLAKNEKDWTGFIFAFCLMLVLIYFIMIAKALNKKVAKERKEMDEQYIPIADGDIAKAPSAPGNVNDNNAETSDEHLSSDDEDEDEKEDNDEWLQEEQELVKA
jgi:hypothetical protein